MLRWDHWHIEASSICALQCSRCPRSEVPESLLNRQLTLSFFQNQIGPSVIKQIRKITFCGNDGDPIYCHDFLEICQWIKTVNPNLELVIITNGSHKKYTWWEQLGQILTARDTVHFSVDGYDQGSNNQYRKNSDFAGIMEAIRTIRTSSDCYLVWAAIAFRFNENHLDVMQNMAQLLDMDSFQLTKSTKFGSKYPAAYGAVDLLEPTKSALISSSHRFERTTTALNTRLQPNQELRIEFLRRSKNLGQYSGICLIGNKGVFLNSQGEFYPCCWVANRYEHNKSWQNRFNLNHQTFEEIINDDFWTSDFLKFDSLECQTKCTPDKLSNVSHTVEW
jgi:MoaA/NifB/PqqE/SkfB family radical SAM enzyme